MKHGTQSNNNDCGCGSGLSAEALSHGLSKVEGLPKGEGGSLSVGGYRCSNCEFINQLKHMQTSIFNVSLKDDQKVYLRSKEKYELFKDLEDEGIEPVDSGSVKKSKIKDVFKKPGETMLFLFDYGANWKFIVNFENFGEKIKEKKYPKIIESKGKAPRQY